MSKINFVEELRWRGMLHDIMPETEALLQKEIVTGYIGFDPTADSLHVGSLAQIMTLLHFQKAGHKPIALIGGATGMVGDPSGKSQERNLLDEDSLQYNLNAIQNQLAKFLDFNAGENAAELVNNFDWFKSFNFLDFIRDVGKHITVNYMMAKDSVKNRLETGMSFTEFSYQLVQGFDFYWLWKNKNVKLQMGGSDQWGNIVTGTELIRRKAAGTAFALTTQLIRKADGTKFGKTEGGNIWLDPNKTSPYLFYQFWINASDDDSKSYIKIFTLKNQTEIEALEAEHDKAPHLRLLQQALAKDITTRVHSHEAYEAALEASEMLFGKGTADGLNKINESNFLSIFENIPHFKIDKTIIETGVNISDLLAVSTNIIESKGEARKLITGGGISINKIKISDAATTINNDFLIHQKYLLVQKGKKNYYLISGH